MSAATTAVARASRRIVTLQNYEFGFKIQNQWTYIDASVYDKEFSGLAFTPVNINNVPIGPPTVYGSTAKGGRLVGSVNPFATSANQPLSTFKITVNGIYEDAHYKDFAGLRHLHQYQQPGGLRRHQRQPARASAEVSDARDAERHAALQLGHVDRAGDLRGHRSSATRTTRS